MSVRSFLISSFSFVLLIQSSHTICDVVAQQDAIETVKKIATAEIKQANESYVAAFNARDAKKMASQWSEKGIYSSRTTGNLVKGREALEREFAALFTEFDNLKLEINSEEIEFISPSVAIDHGTATVTQENSEAIEHSEYSCVFVQSNGRWLIDRISDNLVIKPISHFEHLKELEWLIGKWTNASGDTKIEFECKWTQDKNHISRAYRILEEGGVQQSGMQIIGWDPKNKQIRSWLFDSDGGFVEGVWKKEGDRWLVTTSGTLPDASTGTAVQIVKLIDKDRFGFKKTMQVVDGEEIDDSEEIVIQRKK